MKPNRTIAVYGTLKRGYGLHNTFPEMTHIGDTTVEGFTLFSNGAYPAATPKSGRVIFVEIYDVPEGVFQYIHDIERGAGYDLVPVETEHGPAEMWVWPSPPPGWAKVLPNKEGVENWSR
jgi:gamma-glutamylcyclotransferase (GGCT)/AIG2-like uncharacterized protein YtfP